MSNLVARVQYLRKSRYWFVATVLLVVGAMVPLGIGWRRDRVWDNEMVSRNCAPPIPPHPDTAGLGLTGIFLVFAALLCLLAGVALVLFGQHRWWTKLAAAAFLAVTLLLTLWIGLTILVAIDTHELPRELPCRSYI